METKEGYLRYVHKKVIFIAICTIGLFVAFGVSISVGASDIGFLDSFRYIIDHLTGVEYPRMSDEWLDDIVVWQHRLPRTLYAILAGAALGVAGAAMQSVMHNPLADPYTTGISSGAEFGVSMSVILGINLIEVQAIQDIGTMLNAFVFALVPTVLMVLISPKTRSNPSTLILVGVAVTYLFNSANMFLMVTTDSETMSTVYLWLVGSLGNLSWAAFPLSLLITVIGSAVIMMLSNKLTILAADDSDAKTLGVDADNVRMICLVVIALMAATITCYVGIIGFVGLVCPHIVRTLIDADNKYLIPASAVFSGLFLLCADILSRLVSPNGAVPVGVVMSFIGAPIFLYLLIRRDSDIW